MPQYYCIEGCTNNRSSGTHLFKFPLSKEALLAQWMTAINMAEFQPTKYSVICSEHFTSADFLERPCKKGVRLKHTAVPSIFESAAKSFTKIDALPSNLDSHNTIPVDDESANEISMPLESSLEIKYGTEEVSDTPQDQSVDIDMIEPRAECYFGEQSKKRKITQIVESDQSASGNGENVHTTGIDFFNKRLTKKQKIMLSSIVHIINQELTPRKQKMQRKIKTLQQKLVRKEKQIQSLKELLATVR